MKWATAFHVKLCSGLNVPKYYNGNLPLVPNHFVKSTFFLISCCGCCRGVHITGDFCCQCETAAILKQTGIDREDIIFATFRNKVSAAIITV